MIASFFLEVAGPVTLEELAAWTGVSQRDVKAALARVRAVRVTIDGDGAAGREESWLLESEVDALVRAEVSSAHVALLPFEDNAVALHGGPGVLVDAAHHGRVVPSWGSSKPATLGDARHMAMRGLLCGDRLMGLWEYDPDAGAIVHATLDPVPAALGKVLRDECEAVAAFLRDDIGHARSFSLDTDDALRERAAAIRAMAPGNQAAPAKKRALAKKAAAAKRAAPAKKAAPEAEKTTPAKKPVAAKKSAPAAKRPAARQT